MTSSYRHIFSLFQHDITQKKSCTSTRRVSGKKNQTHILMEIQAKLLEEFVFLTSEEDPHLYIFITTKLGKIQYDFQNQYYY